MGRGAIRGNKGQRGRRGPRDIGNENHDTSAERRFGLFHRLNFSTGAMDFFSDVEAEMKDFEEGALRLGRASIDFSPFNQDKGKLVVVGYREVIAETHKHNKISENNWRGATQEIGRKIYGSEIADSMVGKQIKFFGLVPIEFKGEKQSRSGLALLPEPTEVVDALLNERMIIDGVLTNRKIYPPNYRGNEWTPTLPFLVANVAMSSLIRDTSRYMFGREISATLGPLQEYFERTSSLI